MTAESNIKVLLVGPYPPPYGGLAIQMNQWKDYLSKLQGYDCTVLNIGESRSTPIDGCIPTFGHWDFVKKLYKHCSDRYLIHLLTNGHNGKSWLCACVCAVVGLRNKRRTILVFGSGNAPQYMKHAGPFMGIIIKTALRLGGYFICRNEEMRQALISHGAAVGKTALLPGYLGVNENPSVTIPHEVQWFLKEHYPVLGATATNDPEYGIPLMLEAIEVLRKRYPRIGLLIIGPCEDSRTAFSSSEAFDPIYFAGPLTNCVVLSVMSRLTVFLRPTYFDGDSLSVREALSKGIPVVASDTGLRPPGVLLFPKGQLNELVERVTYALEHLEESRSTSRDDRNPNTVLGLLKIYRSFYDVKRCTTC